MRSYEDVEEYRSIAAPLSRGRAFGEGALIAAGIVALRFLSALLFGWPKYSLPEIGCLCLFVVPLGLRESVTLHVVAPLAGYALAGGLVGLLAFAIPATRRLVPKARCMWMVVMLAMVILVPIVAYQITEWV